MGIVLGAAVSPFLFLAAVPLVLGIVLAVRKRVAIGVTMIVAALLLPIPGAVLVQAVAIRPYRVPSEAMVPTLHVGDRVLVNRLAAPSVGKVIVFHPPTGAQTQACGNPSQGPGHDQACDAPTSEQPSLNFVKRVVAGPGDTIRIVGGHVLRNGRRGADAYARPCPPSQDPGHPCDFHAEITIPKDHWFVMGDDRGVSSDSRYWGPVPASWIVGVAFVRYLPLSRFGFLG